MHTNPAFRGVPAEASATFARDRGFGVLAVNGEAGPLLAHVPFLLAADGRSADLHLTRSNPVARADDGPAVLAVAGPDGYVSPDWYGMDDQVPTWNYVAVHLRGRLSRLPDAALEGHLHALSAAFEGRLCPKAPWTADKMTPGAMGRMMRMILPFRLTVDRIDATWKLNQNKPEAARLGAAAGIARGPSPGSETAVLAGLMRDPPRG